MLSEIFALKSSRSSNPVSTSKSIISIANLGGSDALQVVLHHGQGIGADRAREEDLSSAS